MTDLPPYPRRRSHPLLASLFLILVAGPVTAEATAPAPVPPSTEAGSDPAAVRVVQRLVDRLGGLDAWRSQRHVAWRAFDRRTHFWNVRTGDLRIEGANVLVLMNLDRREGRVWHDGVEVTDPEKLDEMLWIGTHWWQNDGYWLFMPYKLLDPGVRLVDLGERTLEGGGVADVVEVTFEDVGMTPENLFHVWVGRESGRVERWDFFKHRDDDQPTFTRPWEGWRQCGELTLPAGPGETAPWPVALWDELSAALYREPQRPALPPARAGCDPQVIAGGEP